MILSVRREKLDCYNQHHMIKHEQHVTGDVRFCVIAACNGTDNKESNPENQGYE